MSVPAIIIVDKMYSNIVPRLEALGYRVNYQPDIDRNSIKNLLSDYHGLIIRSKTPVDQDLIANARKLRFVARAGAGVDNLDVELLQSREIQVINAPEGNRDSLAEHAMGMLLALMHRLVSADRSVKKGEWEREFFRGVELGGKVIGLIGYGNMGQAFARRLSGFDCRILAFDKYKTEFGDHQVKEATMKELFASCDILSLHVPLTTETKNFYDYQFFSQFSKQIVLVNTARGEILPLRDLKKCMEEGLITAAALDVLEFEPLNKYSDNQGDTIKFLINSPEVILSPHIAGWSRESYRRINDVLIDKISALSPQWGDQLTES